MAERAGRAARKDGAVELTTRPAGLDRAVLWAGGLWLLSFPAMLLYLAIVGMVGSWMGVTFGSPEDAVTERVLNLAYIAMVLGTLGTSVVIGLRGWQRRRLRLALIAAVLSTLTAAAFLLAPALL